MNADHRYLTFWHWSGVTPYTSSCEFAGSCVFDKQLPGILSLRPMLPWASLIPKLRLLFCRVPWGTLTRSPWSSRPDYLCRFTVRLYTIKLRDFSRKLALLNSFGEPPDFRSAWIAIKGRFPDFPGNLSHGTNANPIMR
jgi:hypothetical protein